MPAREPGDSAGAEDIRSNANRERKRIGKRLGDEDVGAAVSDLAEYSGKFMDGGVRGRRRGE
jgi:hypothetical protein